MARGVKRELLDRLLDVYREMQPDERALAMAALRGFDAAVKPRRVPVEVQEAFAELGERVAEEQA